MWNSLTAATQQDFNAIGLTQPIYDGKSSRYLIDDLRRNSILNIYVKLKATHVNGESLWSHVREFKHADLGVLDFSVRDVIRLKEFLKQAKTFTTPSASTSKWETREKCFRNSLHLRHNDKYQHAAEDITAHIDPIGLYAGHGFWSKPLVVFIAPLHLVCYHRYKRTGPKKSS